LKGARDAFGWETEDIKAALLALRPNHFRKSDGSTYLQKDGVILDFYTMRFKGENVYMHFYIDNGVLLVLNSFKEDERTR
ncbi:MAG: hypothetical protein LBW77_06700, partial [Verrucomicrobiota bacterium]|nr:hypothetical protein [Verrucomicrobiota bacterium]